MELETMLKGLGMNLQTKANEVQNTGATGYGAEWVLPTQMASEIYDLIPQRSNLLSLLPGNHGSNLPASYSAPYIGLSIGDMLYEGQQEWSTGTGSATEDDHTQSRRGTPKVTITQKTFIAEIDVSDQLLRRSTPVQIENYLKSELARGMGYTCDYVIVNADSSTGSTGNVNSDDQAPATTFAGAGGSRHASLVFDNGLRKLALAGSYATDAGTLDAGDYLKMISLLGEYGADPTQCLFIQPVQVRAKTLAISDFAEFQKYANNDVIAKGLMPTPYGVDILTHRAVQLTAADGKRDGASPSNNVKGQILALYKPAVQYGFGAEIKLEPVRVAGYGWRFVATFDFGFTVAEASAGLSSPTVSTAYNITVT